jgi:hypothetical protein
MKSKPPLDVPDGGLVTEGGREILKQSHHAASEVMRDVFNDEPLHAITYILELSDCIMEINMEDALGMLMHDADTEEECEEVSQLANRLMAVLAVAFNIKVRYQTYVEKSTGKDASELNNTMQVEKLARGVEPVKGHLEKDEILQMALSGLPKHVLKQILDSMDDDSDDREYD